MGVLLFTVGQVLATSIVLGALKRNGVITWNSKAVHNDVLRTVLDTSVETGEEISVRFERLYHAVMDKSEK
ncbi:hypothetical protein WJX72_004413 [[Myrmecia] bisecta]|uniref:Uncharacterized protein n=1 Tax=[Myrmecia] bisecta TaxID=41462 RepID=A0AAW1QQ55_9CHLO